MGTLAVTNSFSAGTTIVAADMNTNFDDIESFVNTTPGVVQIDIVNAKGDIVAATAADAVSRLAVGTDTHALVADSGEATGLKWAVPTDSTKMPLAGGTFTGAVAAGTDGSGVDVTFHSDTAGDSFLWDSSEEKLILEGTNAATVLDVTDGNVSIGDGTLAVSGAVTVGTDGAGADVTFHSATASDNFLWDASDEKLVITGTDGQNALEVADGDVEITDQLTVSGGLVAPLQINAQTGTTYTFVLADAGKMVTSSNGSAQTLTVPPNSSVAYATGTQIIVQAIGSGTATLAEGSGVTINSKDSNKDIDGQYAAATLIKTATDAWSLIGALA